MKKTTRSFQTRVEWKNPSGRIKHVLDRISRATPTSVAPAPARKQSKQQRRSAGGRNLPDSLPGLAVEWNVGVEYSHVWLDNQAGTFNDDPLLLTRFLRQNLFLPDKSDFLAEGKKVIPAEVLAEAWFKFLGITPFSVSATSKGGRNKGKGKHGAPVPAQKPKWPPSDMRSFDLLMLPHPEEVNQEEMTYVVLGPKNQQTRVTKENWETLRFNTKSLSPEYFPSSYLSPVPTVLTEDKSGSKATFPRSTITGTVETFRTLLLVPLLSNNNKVPSDVYRALSLNIASEATSSTDKATASKRVFAFLRLCHMCIPCEHEDYEEAVQDLDSEVSPDLRSAKNTLDIVREQKLPAIVKAKDEAVSTILQVLYFLQQGHIQFLLGDYRTRILEAHGHDALTVKVRTQKPGRDGLPRAIHDMTSVSSAERSESMFPEGERDTTDSEDEDEGSEVHYHCDVEGDQANTPVSSISQQEIPQPPQRGSRRPGNSVEAAGFGSDTSPRNETGDNEELSRAERK
jgi:hypothetical protein